MSNAQRLATAIKRAVEQHGLPNSFAVGELAQEYGGPEAKQAGIVLRRAPETVASMTGYVIKYLPGKPCRVRVQPKDVP